MNLQALGNIQLFSNWTNELETEIEWKVEVNKEHALPKRSYDTEAFTIIQLFTV